MTTYTFTMQRPKFEDFNFSSPEVNLSFSFSDGDGMTVNEMLEQFHAFLSGCGYVLNGDFYYDHQQS